MSTLLSRIVDFADRDPRRRFARIWGPRGPERDVSYGDLVGGASAVAGRLAAAGIRRGDVVVIIARPGGSLLSAWVAPLLLGAVPSVFPWPTEKLDPGYYADTVAFLLRICGARAILLGRDLERPLACLASGATDVRVVLLEEAEPPAALPLLSRELLEDGEAVTLLQHSSGSTGLQKGVALSSRAILAQIATYGEALKIGEADRVANWMPLYHDGGLIAGFLQPLLRGLPVSLLSPIDWVHDPVLLLRAITEDRATLCWLPNFAYNFLAGKIAERKREGLDLSSMRAFVNTAEPVRLSSHERFRSRFAPLGLDPLALTTSYGAAENVLAITQSEPGRAVAVDRIDREQLVRNRRAVPAGAAADSLPVLSSGRPLPGTRLAVLDEDRRPLPDRRVGELAVRSGCLFTGYFRRPDLTARAFCDGWYLTGDLGYVADGEVYVTGRKKDLIIIGGANIWPQDLESIADLVAGVKPGRTAAFGVDNDLTGTQDLVIVVEAAPEADAAGVAEAVRGAIARRTECVPRTVFVAPPMWLLKTSSGKISRTRCREKFLELGGVA